MAGKHQWQRVTRAEPCSACGKSDWCCVAPLAGLALCMRQESPRPSTGAAGGWIHATGDPIPAYVKPEAKPDPPRLNCTKIIRAWQEQTTRPQLIALADSLGVSPSALAMCGASWAPPYNAWAFPMSNGAGDIVGIRLRDNTGRKWAVTGSRQGVFAPSMAPERRLWIAEGPTDLAALVTLGLFALGRPSCQGAIPETLAFIRAQKVREVVIVADNDDKVRPDGTQWNPGLEGAEKLSAALTVPSVTIALPCKDSREFLQAGGTVEALDYLIGEQPWRQPHSQPSTAQLKGEANFQIRGKDFTEGEKAVKKIGKDNGNSQ